MTALFSYRYFLIFITVFAFYQLFFFYYIKPYYLKKLASKNEKANIPDVAFEVVYLLVLILGLAVSPLMKISPYLLWGAVFLIYGFAITKSSQSYYLASALVFKIHRELSLEQQLRFQRKLIMVACIVSGILFITLFLLSPPWSIFR